MWLPRLSAAWQMNDKTIFRGGYGIYFDTLNVMNQAADQYGFARSTNTMLTNDFGENWLIGNPENGISPLADPFPVRSDGTRFDVSAARRTRSDGACWPGLHFHRLQSPTSASTAMAIRCAARTVQQHDDRGFVLGTMGRPHQRQREGWMRFPSSIGRPVPRAITRSRQS